MKIAIAAGGTGGHIYPGIAIAQKIKEKDSQVQVLFIGSREGLEKELIGREGFQLKQIFARALLRKISYKAISAPFVSLIGFFQCLLILINFKPNYLISTGGYSSIAAVLAAKLLGIPIILHEQNVLPGAVNRFCSKFSSKVFLSFEETRQYLKGEVVGDPVRNSIIQSIKKTSGQTTVLVMGGSQGSRKINQLIIQSLGLIDPEIIIKHILGTRDHDQIIKTIDLNSHKNYVPIKYEYDIAKLLSQADLVISRAGATAIAEFLVMQIPMMLIPFPYAAENHQSLNAQAVAKAGAAILLEEKDLNEQKIADFVNQNPGNYVKMKQACALLAKPNAATKIVNYIYAGNR